MNPVNAGLTTYPRQFVRGTISSWNVSLQQLLPHSHSLTLGYVANRQSGITRQVNQNYGQLGGGKASQPYASKPTSSINIQAPAGQSDVRLAAGEREQADAQGLQYSVAYTYGKTIDWWAGTIPQPEYWYLNKGDGCAAHAQHVGDLRAAIRHRTEIPEQRRRVGDDRRWMADQRVLHRAIGRAVYGHRPLRRSMRALAPTSGRSGEGREILGFEHGGAFFDVLAFKPVTEVRFGTAACTIRCAGPAARIST